VKKCNSRRSALSASAAGWVGKLDIPDGGAG
jgi:hypothetical protein